jgi:hydrogenase nickel incorporation protein HypA/HybF
MSLMEAMLRIVEEAAEAQGCARVTTVVLEVGKLAGVEVEALRFAFEAVTEGSVAEGAVLEIEEPEGLGRCPDCGNVSPVTARTDACPLCLHCPLQVVGGTELRVKALDVE